MKRYLIIVLALVIFLLGLAGYQYFYFNDNKLHVVFCDVGQGDAIFVRTPTNKNILVDGGPDKSSLSCLSNNMPFWERKLDMVILTHPHADHFSGLIYVIDSYIILSFDTERLGNKTQGYKELGKVIKDKKVPTRNIFEGDRYRLGKDLFLEVEAPSLVSLQRSSPNGLIGDSGELASLILKLSYKDFDVLLTGDSQTEALREVAAENKGSIEVMQVPHHGSKTGLSNEIVEFIDPKLAVISVGKGNRYGHPSREVLKSLSDAGIRTLRTDMSGDIEIVSDGKSFRVK